MKFSIMMAALESRREQATYLQNYIKSQIKGHKLEDEVELVVFEDSKEYTVGVKRNTLIENAKGDFVAFVDDDDWVSSSYVKNISDIIINSPTIDCIGMKGALINPYIGVKEFIHSIRYKEYTEDAYLYYRPPNHLNPIKREIALQFKFPSINLGEDFNWSMEICKSGILQNEVFLDSIIYFYNFSLRNTETQKKDHCTTIL